MTGKTSGTYKGRAYRGYRCVRAQKAKESCAYSNIHSARLIDPAVLEYLGQFSDPAHVTEPLKQARETEIRRKKSELTKLEKRLAALDSDFHRNLDFLKKPRRS